jgi:riboflavin kinase / FMN adenylyltransferase
MNVHQGINGLKQVPDGAVLSIGNFDGMHLGHRKIIETMNAVRPAGARLAVATFEPHPLTVLRPQLAPPRLSPEPIKRKLLESAGVDDLVIFPPTREVLDLTAEQFWTILRDEVKPSHIVEGSTFNFGKGRGGTIEKLQMWTAQSNVQLHVIDGVQVPLLDLQVVQVSSSLIRWLISYGRVRDAAIGLGRPYVLYGSVIRGHGRGRTMGVPTMNLDVRDQLVPAEGVYVGRCRIDSTTYPAAVSIGTTPTFGDGRLQVEAHLIGFNGDLYDRAIEVELIDWVREQIRFQGVDRLKEQLARDFARVQSRVGLDPTQKITDLIRM